jgi:hypothetical protein
MTRPAACGDGAEGRSGAHPPGVRSGGFLRDRGYGTGPASAASRLSASFCQAREGRLTAWRVRGSREPNPGERSGAGTLPGRAAVPEWHGVSAGPAQLWRRRRTCGPCCPSAA